MNGVLLLRVAARYLKAASKRMLVFDFDDTLVSSKGVVSVTKAGGEKIKMDSATFAHYKPMNGDKLDFGAFNDVIEPRKIKKNFDRLRQAVKDGDRVVILTARAKGAASSVTKFLKSEGVEGVDVVGLGSSDPYDKARWITNAVEEHGYTDVEFYDDSHANTAAVADQGEKHHKDINFKANNVPHPKEDDYDGDIIREHFKSDDPMAAVVEYKAKEPSESESKPERTDDKPATSDWWKEQTDSFKHNYCREHDESKYCR
jgi:acid phosphatase class B